MLLFSITGTFVNVDTIKGVLLRTLHKFAINFTMQIGRASKCIIFYIIIHGAGISNEIEQKETWYMEKERVHETRSFILERSMISIPSTVLLMHRLLIKTTQLQYACALRSGHIDSILASTILRNISHVTLISYFPQIALIFCGICIRTARRIDHFILSAFHFSSLLNDYCVHMFLIYKRKLKEFFILLNSIK